MTIRVIIVNIDTVVEDCAQVEDLMILDHQLKVLDESYQGLGLETPEWIVDKLAETGREVNLRVRSELQRRLKTAQARRAALATVSEKRDILDAQIKDIEGRLE